MNLQDIINPLLTSYAPHALPMAIGASILLLMLPFAYAIVRGQAIRRSSTGNSSSKWVKVLAILIFMAVPIAVISWATIAGRAYVLRRSGVLDEILAQRIVILIGFATLVLWIGLFMLTRPGTPFSETLNLLTGGVRRRKDNLGSAHFADKLEYKRFASKQAHGVTLLGQFRGEEFKPN
jgi:hypothetical protein